MDSPKRPLSSYFFYMEKNRAIFQNEYPNKSHKELLTIMSEKWNSLNSEDKDIYIKLAEKDKKRYNEQMTAYNAIGRPASNKNNIDNAKDSTSEGVGEAIKPILPIAPIKRLIKMDEEVHNISKNALLSVTLATEKFIYTFAKDVQDISHLNGRKACQLSDIAHVMKHNRRYEFLERDIKKRCVRPIVSNDSQCLSESNDNIKSINGANNNDHPGFPNKSITVNMDNSNLTIGNLYQSVNSITQTSNLINAEDHLNTIANMEDDVDIDLRDNGDDDKELADMIDSDGLIEEDTDDESNNEDDSTNTRYDNVNDDFE